MYQQVIEKMKQKLEEAGLYPLQKQAELSTRILEERLETVLPWAMEEWRGKNSENGSGNAFSGNEPYL